MKVDINLIVLYCIVLYCIVLYCIVLLSKIWGWAFKSSLYLEKLENDGEFAIYLIIYMAAMLVCDFRW